MEKNKIRKYKLMITAIAMILLILSTATALKIEQPIESNEPEDKQQKQEQVKKNGIIFCYTGLFLPPADTIPIRARIELKSLDGTIIRKIPAYMGFLHLKIILNIPIDKEYQITAYWKDKSVTEIVPEFNVIGIIGVTLIIQEDGP